MVSSQPFVTLLCILYIPFSNTLLEFSNIWETPFNTVDETVFQCQKDRGTGDVSTSMFLINHYLDTMVLGNPAPDVASANITNAVSGPGSLGEEIAVCTGLYDRYPNFLLVDVRPLPPVMSRHWLNHPTVLRVRWRLCVPSCCDCQSCYLHRDRPNSKAYL